MQYGILTVVLVISFINDGFSSPKQQEDNIDVSISLIAQKFENALDVKLNNLKTSILSEFPQKSIGNDRFSSQPVPTIRTYNSSFGVGVDADGSFYKDSTCNTTTYPKNCYEIWEKGSRESGIYVIKPKLSKKPFQVLCDMEIEDGGWTHIQKRVDGHIDFFRNWRDYRFGFGYLDEDHEFWLGLENIYTLLDQQPNELLIEIVDRDGEKAYALYEEFAIGREEDAYPLKTLSGIKGSAGDSLSYHLGMKFSTFDFDQDNLTTDNCAEIYKGGWWYNSCHQSNLNGKFVNVNLPASYNYQGIHWKTYKSHEYCHANARMLTRPTKL